MEDRSNSIGSNRMQFKQGMTRNSTIKCHPVHAFVLSPSVESNYVGPRGLQPARLLCPWDSPGKNTGVGCHFLLYGIFWTQGSNSGLLHRKQILYHLSHQGSRQFRMEGLFDFEAL